MRSRQSRSTSLEIEVGADVQVEQGQLHAQLAQRLLDGGGQALAPPERVGILQIICDSYNLDVRML